MQRLLAWFVGLPRFYRISFVAWLVFGLLVAIPGVATGNLTLVLLGVVWILGGGALVDFAASRDPDA